MKIPRVQLIGALKPVLTQPALTLIGVWLTGRGEVVEYYINKIELPELTGILMGRLAYPNATA